MDTAALKESWAAVAKHGDEVPMFFYSHLFLTHPETRELFPISIATQHDKLIGALGRIVSNVDRYDEDVEFVRQLARDQRRLGAVADHYPAVGESLLATLKHFLGPAWTPELAQDWARAYGLIAKVMLEAVQEATTPPSWTADVVALERRTLDVSIFTIRPTEEYPYRPGQSCAVEVPQRPKLWRYYSPANAPRDDGTIELHVALVPGGQVSSSLTHGARPGDTVRLGAPLGTRLTSPDGVRPDLIMVAGGTGLAPLRAVLEQIDREWLARSRAPQVQLFHGARTASNLYERPLLKALATRPWFDYCEVVSDDPTYLGERGLVGSVAASRGQWRGRKALVCGSGPMVQHTVPELVSAGMPADDIRFEDYVCPEFELEKDQQLLTEIGERQ